MKEKFVEPEMEKILFDETDILTTSGLGPDLEEDAGED